jgi:hypothetical protein
VPLWALTHTRWSDGGEVLASVPPSGTRWLGGMFECLSCRQPPSFI